MIKVAINGLGRIGRATLKVLMDAHKLKLIAVNDIASAENLVYLLKHDSVYRNYNRLIELQDSKPLVVRITNFLRIYEQDFYSKIRIRIVIRTWQLDRM